MRLFLADAPADPASQIRDAGRNPIDMEIGSQTDPISLELLRAIDAKLDLLLANTKRASHLRPSSLSRDDRMLLARLLPVIAATYGSEGFTSRDLAEDAAPGLRLVLGELSAKSIGRLLARAANTPIAGLMVQRHGVAINVTLWHVVAC